MGSATETAGAGGGANTEEAMERNLRLIPAHHALTRASVWMPVFVLFTRSRFEIAGALLLGSLYYLFVVVLEVPSGWMSDRVGRVATLRVASGGFVAAQVLYLVGGDNFTVIAAGQFCLAVGYASLSGTDVSFHYDSLEALGADETFASRQARLSAVGFVSAAVSALAGGLLGLVDLRLTFAVSLVLALFQVGVVLRLVEPPTTGVALAPIGQVARCLRYLSDRYLGWIFLYGVLLVTLEHVAFTMMQPWLTEVLGRSADDVGSTPLFAGVVFAVVAMIGALAARASAAVGKRFGTTTTLIGLAVLSATVVTGMALSFHWAMIGLAALRSVQGAASPVLMSAAVAPRTQQQHRATLLSLNSLGGRLGYGLLLATLSVGAADDVARVLAQFALISWAMVAALIATASLMAGQRPTKRGWRFSRKARIPSA